MRSSICRHGAQGRHLCRDRNVRIKIKMKITLWSAEVDLINKYLGSMWYEAGVLLNDCANTNSHNPDSDSIR